MRVIVVDDEKMALENLRMKIASVKRISHVEAFQLPNQALEYLDEHAVDIAFLDINMRQLDGLSLAKVIKEKQPDIFIIFVTGYSEFAPQAYRMHAAGYLMKPVSVEDIEGEIDYIQNPPPAPAVLKKGKRIRVQCFGKFELFIDEEPVHFRRNKTKELFAYLVDRVGAACNTADLCNVLWEEGPVTMSMKSQIRNSAAELSHILGEKGLRSVLIKNRNSYAVNVNEIDCDYYKFRMKDPIAVNLYYGEYMSQYSWAEMTTGAIESGLKR